jgi:hypothetical protein
MTRLGPKTAGKIKKPPKPPCPTHSEAKENTRGRQVERESAMTKTLGGVQRGTPSQGQPSNPTTPKVKKRSH